MYCGPMYNPLTLTMSNTYTVFIIYQALCAFTKRQVYSSKRSILIILAKAVHNDYIIWSG